MRFRPQSGPAQQVLLPSALVALTVGVLLGWVSVTGAIGLGSFILLLLGLALIALGLLTLVYGLSFRGLAYRLDRNGLVISAGLWSVSLPMDAITGIYSAPPTNLDGEFTGLRIPGHNVGVQSLADGPDLVSVATAAPEDCLYLKTESAVYAISPAEPDLFRRVYEMERSLGPVRALPEGLQLPPVLRRLVWRDRLGRTLAAAAVGGALVLLALAFWRYPGLPAQVPMHFDAQGLPDRLAPPNSIFYLPAVGLVVLIVNSALAAWMYRHERVLAHFLWGGALLVQLILILALCTITA